MYALRIKIHLRETSSQICKTRQHRCSIVVRCGAVKGKWKWKERSTAERRKHVHECEYAFARMNQAPPVSNSSNDAHILSFSLNNTNYNYNNNHQWAPKLVTTCCSKPWWNIPILHSPDTSVHDTFPSPTLTANSMYK